MYVRVYVCLMVGVSAQAAVGVCVLPVLPVYVWLVFHPQTLVYATVSEQLNSSGWQERLAACAVLPMLHGPVTKVGGEGRGGEHTVVCHLLCANVCGLCGEGAGLRSFASPLQLVGISISCACADGVCVCVCACVRACVCVCV